MLCVHLSCMRCVYIDLLYSTRNVEVVEIENAVLVGYFCGPLMVVLILGPRFPHGNSRIFLFFLACLPDRACCAHEAQQIAPLSLACLVFVVDIDVLRAINIVNQSGPAVYSHMV